MALIFYLSSQPASESNELSNQVTEVIVETIEKAAPEIASSWDLKELNHIIRKNAHFFSYFVLGVLVMNALYQKGYRKVALTYQKEYRKAVSKNQKVYRKVVSTYQKGYRKVVLSLIICILYSISDEIHQTFVPGRGGNIIDVLIDSTGSFIGIGLYLKVRR
jgi:VanZ family protein